MARLSHWQCDKGGGHGRARAVQPEARRLPAAWYNIMPDLAQVTQPLPPLHPGTHEPVGPADLAPLFPEALIMQEVSTDAVDRHPRPGPRRLPAVEADAPVPGAPARAGAADARPHLLQVRGHVAPGRTSRTPRSRRPTTTRRRGSGGWPPRRAPGQWGSALSYGVPVLRPRVPGLHGQGLVRAEALPADLHGDVRRTVRRLAEHRDAGRQDDPGRPRTRPGRSASPSARRWRSPRRTTTPTTRWAACSTTSCCTRR